MPAQIPQRAAPSIVPAPDPDPWDLQVDAQEAARRKHQRLVLLNTVSIPRLRALGFGFLSIAVILYNQFLRGDPGWETWAQLTLVMAVYCAASWYALHLFFADFQRHLDLGTIFLACDLWVFSLVIYVTGAERSWLFFLPVFRVFDQAGVSVRRSVAFAHLAPLSYLSVLLYVAVLDHRLIAPGPEIAKIALIYLGSVYVAAVGRAAVQRRLRLAHAIRRAREVVDELRHRSSAMEASARELRASVEKQARLAAKNAELYAVAQREKARQSQIFDSTSDGIIFVSPDGRIEAANVRAGDLLAFDPPSVIGVDVASVVSRLYAIGDGDSFLPQLQTLLADPWGDGSGDLQQPATGRVLHWVAQPARDGSGGSAGLTFTFQDVTRPRDLLQQVEDKSRLLEDARRRSEDANRAKGEFLANVSHEIRTPLSAIIGMAQLMRETGAQDEMLRRIQTSAESLMVIIGDILDFSKIESRKLTLAREPFPLRHTLGDAVDILRLRAGEKHLDLALEVLPDVPDALLGDPMRLRQVLINLIGNAVKFTEHGEVRLRVSIATELPGEVCLHFAVIDTGIGIPHDKRDLVFEAFAQADGSAARRYGGTGLGLSISARLVELMGGDIWVDSEDGRGSAFRFTAQFGVDGHGPESAGPASVTSSAVVRAGPKTVLVVEDEDVHREILAALLLARGHRVITAKNGRDALLELSRHAIDVALMDLQMPEMDGFQTAAAIRRWEESAGGHLPIVAMTASALGDDPDRCLSAGMDRFVTKPINRELLFRAVEALADQSVPQSLPPELADRSTFLSGLGDDRELARKLIAIFVEQSPALLSRTRAAIAAGDVEDLRGAAHKLKGMISNFPAGAACEAATRMEAIGFDSDLVAAQDLYPILEQEVERLKTLLPALL